MSIKPETLKQIEAQMETARNAASVNILVDDLAQLVKCAHLAKEQAVYLIECRAFAASMRQQSDAASAKNNSLYELNQEQANKIDTLTAQVTELNDAIARHEDELGKNEIALAEQAAEIERMIAAADAGGFDNTNDVD